MKPSLIFVITAGFLMTSGLEAAVWEYCFLFIPQGHSETRNEGRLPSLASSARICYAGPTGCSWRDVRFIRNEISSDPNERKFLDLPDDALSRALSILGEEGWEMIVAGAGASLYPERPTILYFKRSKQQKN